MDKFMLCTMLFIMSVFGYVDSILHVGSGCSQARNSTPNTAYQANLRTLLGSLVTNVPLQNNFFNTSVGNGSNQVYGLAWCRADVSRDTCSECLNDSISAPLRDCIESKDLEIWSSFCSLRFSNKSFFGQLWNSSSSSSYGGSGLDDPTMFSKGFSMMETLVRNVSNQPLMFETGAVNVGNDENRYGLGQCRRDLSKLDCENCLEELLMNYRKYVLNRTGWEMLGVSCGMWYDDVRFYDNNNSGPTPEPNTSGGERWFKGDVMLIFVTFLVLIWIP